MINTSERTPVKRAKDCHVEGRDAARDWKISELLPALNGDMKGCGRLEQRRMGKLGIEGLKTEALIQLSPLPLRCVSRTIGAHE